MAQAMTEHDGMFGGLAEPEWDRLAGDRFYSTTAWLRYCSDDTGVPGAGVVVRDGGRPVAAAPVRELSHLPPWSRYRWNDHLREFGLPELSAAGTLIGPSEGFQTHLLVPPGPPSDAVPDLLAGLRGWRPPGRAGDEAGRPCVAMYTTSEDVRLLRSAGVEAEPVLLDADPWIPVPAGGWDEWLAGMPKKRRANIRREADRFAAAGYEIEHAPLAELAGQLGEASAGTLHKYGHETTVTDEVAALRQVAASLGDLARVAVCRLPGREIAGFCIYYEWAGTVFVRWAGFRYDLLIDVAEYFNLLYYCHIRRAPERGVRWIHAGTTSLPGKVLRGAELRPIWLLDLAADSPLIGAGPAIRRHNQAVHADLAADPRLAAALVPDPLWGPAA